MFTLNSVIICSLQKTLKNMEFPVEPLNCSLASNAIRNEILNVKSDYESNDEKLHTTMHSLDALSDLPSELNVNKIRNIGDKVLVYSHSANKWTAGQIIQIIQSECVKKIRVKYHVNKTIIYKKLNINTNEIKNYDIKTRNIDCLCGNIMKMCNVEWNDDNISEYELKVDNDDLMYCSSIAEVNSCVNDNNLTVQLSKCQICRKSICKGDYFFKCIDGKSKVHVGGYTLCLKCAVNMHLLCYILILCHILIECIF